MQRPGSNRPRTFRYEEDMAWCRDYLVLDGSKRPRVSYAVAGVGAGVGVGVVGDGSSPDASGVSGAKVKPEDVEWQPFWTYLDSQKVNVEGTAAAYIERALGYLLHPDKRMPLVELWRLQSNAAWPLEVLLTHLKAAIDAYD